MADESNRVREIFLAAIEQHAPEEWPGFLDEICAQEPAIRGKVERLLRAQAQLGSFHEVMKPAPTATLDEPFREGPGTMIGPYKLLEQIGEGGMGLVFVAEQQQPIRRKVALKVIRPGMDTRHVVARFEAERQALALMDHPNIAKVHDGGQTASGLPYFVMELVTGVPITDYCDQNQLSIRQRVELFVSVCQAVQHAHQKGIIHRDLKPSNVLVALHDTVAVPKIIDFGIAKAVGQPLTEKTLVTGLGQVVGTLEYMSPEQAELNQLDIDTRSDIYSLGVLLYELLTGTTPLDRHRLKEAGLLEMLRSIREEDPPRPSDRLRSSPRLTTLSEHRGLEPARLIRLVREELDWIVMCALEKDRSRRYETAAALVDDLQRYLADEPVRAAPPSAGYRFRKFLRRRRKPLLAAGMLIVLAVGLIATTLLALRLNETEAELQKNEQRIGGTRAELSATTRRLDDERHAKQLGLALVALERHDLTEAERALGQTNTAYELTWEQRHMRWLCSRVHRLNPLLGGNRLNVAAFGNSAAISPDDLQIASLVYRRGEAGMLKVCELATGQEKIAIPIDLTSFGKPVFSPDGRRIALARTSFGGADGDRGSVVIFDAQRGKRTLTLQGKSWDEAELVDSVAFSKDGRHLVAKSLNGQVSVWDAANGREVFSLNGPNSNIKLLRFGPKGKQIVTIHSGNQGWGPGAGVWLWDGETGEPKFQLRKATAGLAEASAMAFSPDGRRIAVIGTRPQNPHQSSSELCIYNTETGQVEVTIQKAEAYAIKELAFSGDGHFLIAQYQNNSSLYVCDAVTGQEKHLESVQEKDKPKWADRNPIKCFAVSADGRRIAAGYESGTATVWDLATGKMLFTAKDLLALDGANHLPGITKMAFSPDGRRLAYCRDRLWSIGQADPGSRSWVKVLDFTAKRIELTIPLKGHTFTIDSLLFSSDGRRIIALNREKKGAITEWDLKTGEVKNSFDAPDTNITTARAYLPDGPCFAVRDGKGAFVVQDAATGKRRLTLKSKFVGQIRSVAFSPDGKRIATRNGDKSVTMWSLTTNRPIFILPGFWGDFSRESFSPDGKQLALVAEGPDGDQLASMAGGGIGKVFDNGVGKVFDAMQGRDEVRRPPFNTGRLDEVTSGRELVTIGSGDSRLVRLVFSPDAHNLINPHGHNLVGITQDGRVQMFNSSSGRNWGSVEEEWGIVGVFPSSNGRSMAAVSRGNPHGGGSQRVRLWDILDIRNNRFRDRLIEFPGQRVVWVVFTGYTAHVITSERQGIRVWDEDTTFQAGLTIKDGLGNACSVAISPDGRLIATGGASNKVKIWDARTGKEKKSLEVKDTDLFIDRPLGNGRTGRVRFLAPVRSVCFSPDSRRLVAALAGDKTIRGWDVQTGREVLTLRGHQERLLNVAWSRNGQRIVSSSSDGTIRVWDAQTGQEQLAIPMSIRDLPLLAISPDGNSVIDPGRYEFDSKLGWLPKSLPAIRDATTGKAKLNLQGTPGPRYLCAAFSPDGRRIVMGAANGTLRVWNTATGEEQLVLKGHTSEVLCVAFSPDGQRIVSGGRGKAEPGKIGSVPGELKLWDAFTGLEKLSFKGHIGPVLGVAFSSNGQRFVSVGEDSTVRVWEASTDQPQTQPR